MSKCKFFYGEQMLSPKGEASYAYINTRVNVMNGDEKGYAITLKFNDKDTKKLQDTLAKQLEAAKETDDGKELQWNGDAYPGCTEDSEGNTVFKFKSTKKDKNEQWRKVGLVDSKNNPIDLNTNIGSGSIIRAIFTPAVYWVNKKNFGVTLYVDKLQVVELKEYSGGSGKTMDFPEEDGYVAPVSFPAEEDDDDNLPI